MYSWAVSGKVFQQCRKVVWEIFNKINSTCNERTESKMPRPSSEELRWRAIWMKEFLGCSVDEGAVRIQACVEAPSRYHDTKTRPKTKGFISKNAASARAPRLLVHFPYFLCKTWRKMSKVKVQGHSTIILGEMCARESQTVLRNSRFYVSKQLQISLPKTSKRFAKRDK